MLYDCATNEVKFTLNAHKNGIVDFDWYYNIIIRLKLLV